jgi:hypothetical protein
MGKLKKEHAQDILWSRGNLNWKLHVGQEVIEKAYRGVKRKLFVANCARRFGKTFWACIKSVECAISCANQWPRIKYASATRLDLKEFAIPAFEYILLDCPDDLRPIWRATDSKYVFPHNGAEIQLVGLDKRPDGGRGNYCDLYIFEEAGQIDNLEYLYSSVVSPMTLRREGAKILMISTPSHTPAHPFSEFCDRGKFQDAYVELNIFDNPLMSDTDREQAREECLSESDWLREYMCQHVVDENLAITPEWKPEYEREVKRPDYFSFLHRYVGMDLGTKIDLTALVFGYWDPIHRALIVENEEEINGPQMTTPDLAVLVRKVEKDAWSGLPAPYRRVSDNDNPLLIQDLGYLHDLHFTPTGKDNLHAMVNDLRRMVKAGKIIIHPRCKKTIGCLRGAIWDKQRKQFSRSKMFGHFDHLAALIYLVRNLDQESNPVPALRDIVPGETYLREVKKELEMVKNIKQILNLNRYNKGD